MRNLKEADEFCVRKPSKNQIFNNGGVVQASLGNQFSMVLFQEKGPQTLVYSGSAFVRIDESMEAQKTFTKEELDFVQEITSQPFAFEFKQPVVKVSCGDHFGALLTSLGELTEL